MPIKKLIESQPLLCGGIALLLLVGSISLVKGNGDVGVATAEPDQPGLALAKGAPVEADSQHSTKSLNLTRPESKSDAIGVVSGNIRVVMPTVKNCKIVGAKVGAACTEVEIYQNARPNSKEVLAMLPNGRKVEVLESAGEWSHVRIFAIDGTPSSKVGWVRSMWIVKPGK